MTRFRIHLTRLERRIGASGLTLTGFLMLMQALGVRL